MASVFDSPLRPGAHPAQAVPNLTAPLPPAPQLIDPTDGVSRASAPRRVFRAYHQSAAEGWSGWVSYLRRRREPGRIAPGGGEKGALLWGVPEGAIDSSRQGWSDGLDALCEATGKTGRDEKKLRKLVRKLAGEMSHWANVTHRHEQPLDGPLSALTCGYALPWIVGGFEAGEAWWETLSRLCEISRQAIAAAAELSAVERQLLAGELPLLLATLFPELKPCRSLTEPARKTIGESLASTLDESGFARRETAQDVPLLVASWTRCRALGVGKKGAWDKAGEKLYRRAVQNGLRWLGAGGGLMLAGGAGVDCRLLFRAAAEKFGHEATARAARIATRKAGGEEKAGEQSHKTSRKTKILSPSGSSETAGLAMLRCDWGAMSPRLAVSWGGDDMRIELATRGESLVYGRHEIEVRYNGAKLRSLDAWTESCWISDNDVDYLELNLDLEGGVCVERHIALARRDRVLLVADAVLAPEPGMLEYAVKFPVVKRGHFATAEESREGWLTTGKARAAALPLALGEWRSDGRRGELEATDGALRLAQVAEGRALFAPLFFDLKPSSKDDEPTWRRLTVGEERKRVAQDVAVGFRAEIGERQWLVYRSLAPTGNRSVLAQNLSTEFLFCRFRRSGKIEKIVEIEGPIHETAESEGS